MFPSKKLEWVPDGRKICKMLISPLPSIIA
uniref:Uncharacterized protein n=1 Tax=Rhizophora mucronata TaxID=61149 RepID=A0A2P2NWH4_RHIMU